jgi:hypothetical protein
VAVYLDQNDPAYGLLNENDLIAAVSDIR